MIAFVDDSTSRGVKEPYDNIEAAGLDDGDSDEANAFLSFRSAESHVKESALPKTGKLLSTQRKFYAVIVAVACIGSAYLYASSTNDTMSDAKPRNHEPDYPMYRCPADTMSKKPENYDEAFVEIYENATQMLTDNMTEFLATMHKTVFDAWDRSYDEVKASIYDWKASQIAPYLEDGYTIYESAAGIGLNLYLTLEILYEVKGVKNIRVYGNDYEALSAEKANKIFDEIPPANAKKGVICAADSSDLSFIPADSFDLVFTGYLR